MALRDVSIDGRNFSLSYEIVRPSCEKKILFLHGWGANKEIMKQAFGGLFQDYGLVFLDLPGFGGSSNSYILTTKDYAQITGEFLKRIDVQPFGIIGHSFGGKVAALLNPPRLALLGSAGIVLPKPIGIQAKIAISKVAKAVGIGKSLRNLFASSDAKDMSNEMYETFKLVVDEDFTPYFKAVTSKTALLWGISDTASPLQAGNIIAGLIKDSSFYKLEGNHFFFLANQTMCEQLILKKWI